ncbi:acetyl-coenzyme A transporter 1-domain-containing protein [Syncephalis plumigaleata]|nr:acetyl-coenzyme A transporter 1-domain-containing protein [Syncephalis plumigaleata]
MELKHRLVSLSIMEQYTLFGSIPFLMKDYMSYSQLGVLSLKLFWSPIVDALFVSRIGRRKTWIIPIQLILGVVFLWLGNNIEKYMVTTGDGWGSTYTLTLILLATIILSATQDIAVDGWALTLLPEEHLSYASTAQTIGLNTGHFLSFTVFLAFSSAEFCNTYFRSIPSDVGILTLTNYMHFWAAMYFLVTTWLIFFKHEAPVGKDDEMSIGESYQVLWRICKLPQMSQYIVLLLVAKMGFVVSDAVGSLKLLEKGFKREDLALTVLWDFPCQILFGYLAGWCHSGYMVIITIVVLWSSFASTVQFVGIGVFMNSIADPAVGGTYMTFLNTLSNLGGTWPRYFVLEAVDWFTNAQCHIPNQPSSVFQCTSEIGKKECKTLGGQCTIYQDGYYIVSGISIVISITLLLFFIRGTARVLNVTIPPATWRIVKVAKD